MVRLRSSITVAFLLTALACDSDVADTSSNFTDTATTETDSGHEDEHFSESCGEPGETYTAGMSHIGDMGTVEFILVASDPAPPDKGINVFTMKVIDIATGAPIDGATVPITPFMPEHGHGTNPEFYTTEANGDAGTYESVPMDLFMSGLWTLTFAVESGDAVLDESTFTFCMEG